MVILTTLLIFLFLIAIYVFLRYLFGVCMGQLITNIVLVALYLLAGSMLVQHGFPLNPEAPLASIISTGVLIITPLIALLIGFINFHEDKKQQKEERAYQMEMFEKRKLEERIYQEELFEKRKLEERAYQEELRKEKKEERAYQEQLRKEKRKEEESDRIRTAILGKKHY